MANLRELSKRNFSSLNGSTLEAISTGSLQRIADATELMAKNFIALQNDRDMYKRWYYEGNAKNTKLCKQISALKGVITKLKNKNNGK